MYYVCVRERMYAMEALLFTKIFNSNRKGRRTQKYNLNCKLCISLGSIYVLQIIFFCFPFFAVGCFCRLLSPLCLYKTFCRRYAQAFGISDFFLSNICSIEAPYQACKFRLTVYKYQGWLARDIFSSFAIYSFRFVVFFLGGVSMMLMRIHLFVFRNALHSTFLQIKWFLLYGKPKNMNRSK